MAVLFGLMLVGSAAFLVGAFTADPTITPAPSTPLTGATQSPAPSDVPAPSGTSPEPSGAASEPPTGTVAPGTPGPSEGPTPSAEPTLGPIVDTAMPIVPVVRYWSTLETVSRRELEDALRGRSSRWDRVVVPTGDSGAIAAALGIELGASVTEGDPEQIARAVKDDALGLMRAVDVTPRVRALGIGGVELVGHDRTREAGVWPLTITVASDRTWDQATTWSMAAGGDILLDRGVYVPTKINGKGADFLFDGGTAEITGRRCCSPFFNDTYVLYRRTGNVGAMRRFFRDADLAIANLENPTPPDAVFHKHGTVFTGHPWMLEGLQNAGLDYLSLANNHMRDAGDDGIMQTRRELERRGFTFSGAGRDLAQARELVILEAAGQRVAIVPCNDIARYIWAKANKPGTAPCRDRNVIDSIREAREQADVVIVFPHWGVEYTAHAYPSQRAHARTWVEAGADLIIGAHSHWAGAMEDIDGRLVFYSLGNFIFDQWFTEETSEAFVLELTWHGARLVQARIHPTLVIEQGQPNFTDPNGDGQIVLKRVRNASRGQLDY